MNYIPVFDGLSKQLPACLQALEGNNSREWFQAHRQEFQQQVAEPLAALIEAIAPDMVRLDDALISRLSRPQRDIRFSRDKSPYRTQMWFVFRRDQPDWAGHPAFFFEAGPEHCRWGMGWYAARPATMAALRGIAQEDPGRFLAAMAAATARGFALHGDPYKRQPPVPAGMPEEIAELSRRRNVYLCRMTGYEPPLLNSEFATILAADYAALGALYGLFCLANAPPLP